MSSIWDDSRSVRALSSTLNQMLVSEIGLCRLGSFGLLAFFGRSTIVASPNSAGTFFDVHMWVIRACVIFTAVSPPVCKASALMLSGPVALFRARSLTIFATSFLLGGAVAGVMV